MSVSVHVCVPSNGVLCQAFVESFGRESSHTASQLTIMTNLPCDKERASVLQVCVFVFLIK